MGYHVVDPDDLEPEPDRPSEMRYVSEAAGMENLGLREYRVEPGEEIPLSGLHYHDRQEEAFYVVEGELSVETPDREYVVEAGQFFVAEPNSPHRAYVDGEAPGTARLVAVGAPPVSDGHSYPDDEPV
jgi:uncharacterized cupin superfamily protein